MAGLMELIEVYETTKDDNAAEEVLDSIIDKLQEVEQCGQDVAIEFAYMLKLARANDQKIPGRYILQRLFGFIRLSVVSKRRQRDAAIVKQQQPGAQS